MSFRVLVTDGASEDLHSIIEFVAEHDSITRASQLLDRFESTIAVLATNPERGSVPKELQAVGINNFRQVFFKPYRLLYRIEKKTVYIVLIADGRRNMQGLLQRRLLGA